MFRYLKDAFQKTGFDLSNKERANQANPMAAAVAKQIFPINIKSELNKAT